MRRKKKLYIILAIIQLFIAIVAIPVGLGFIIDTSGQGIGMSTGLLVNSPFNNFLIPGLFLLIVHGLGNLFGTLLSFFKSYYTGQIAILLGYAQILWIVFQVIWIGLNSFLQPLFFVIGIVEVILGYTIYKKMQKQNQQVNYR